MPHYLAIFEYREGKVARVEVTDDVVGCLSQMNDLPEEYGPANPYCLVQAFPFQTRPEALEALAEMVSMAMVLGDLKGKANALIKACPRTVAKPEDRQTFPLRCISDNTTTPAKENTDAD